jgi:hypothetical protein
MSLSPSLRPLGKIVRLQIQRARLTGGEKPNRVYDPAPLLVLDELTLTPHGALARLPDGGTLLDLHHAHHPQTRNDHGLNSLSVGFTSHYAAIRREFEGDHLFNGCAGENILIETQVMITLDQLAHGLAIQPQDGGPLIWLKQMRVAHPCRPFSGYVMGGSEALVKEALQFLNDGMRGFYCALAQPQPAIVAVGDEALAAVAMPQTESKLA